jgi:hypothetical protein
MCLAAGVIGDVNCNMALLETGIVHIVADGSSALLLMKYGRAAHQLNWLLIHSAVVEMCLAAGVIGDVNCNMALLET